MLIVSLIIVFIIGSVAGKLISKISLPPLVGMILSGIVIGSFGLNLLSESFYSISDWIRMIALLIVLIRAGLSIDLKDFKTMGFKAILMSFLPTLFEMLGCFLGATVLFKMTAIQALLLATILASASPAVTIPRMVKLIEEGYGNRKAIPQMVMASDAIDDVINLVMFSTMLTLNAGSEIDLMAFSRIPITVIIGLTIGGIFGFILVKLSKVLKTFSLFSLILVVGIVISVFEARINLYIPFSSLIVIIMMNVPLKDTEYLNVSKLKDWMNSLWRFAQIFLFVWVGTQLNIHTVKTAITPSILLFFMLIIFRSIGVFSTLLGSNLNIKERTFVALCGIPKATVQASIGLVPLAMGIQGGALIAMISTLSILITAPLGAVLLDQLSHSLLESDFIELSETNVLTS